MQIKSAKDLRVYKKAYALAMAVFHVSKNWPVEEKYSLTDQIRGVRGLYVRTFVRLGQKEDMQLIL
jgi:hypothetical protein